MTGTPARVDFRTVNFDGLEEQPGEAHDRFFSFDESVHVKREQMSCYLTRTTAATHKLIRDNLGECFDSQPSSNYTTVRQTSNGVDCCSANGIILVVSR